MGRTSAPRALTTGAGAVVAERCAEARGFVARGIGLMGRSELPDGEGLWIEPCGSIHMFFMRFPLDVAFVDREGRVVRVCRGIRPWRMTLPVRRARAAVELPAGTLGRHGVDVGEVLRLS